jgi:hypothetical protein
MKVTDSVILPIMVGDKIKMLNIPEFKRFHRVFTSVKNSNYTPNEKAASVQQGNYTSFTVAVGTIGIVKGVHNHFLEVDWEGCPKVTEFTNPVISCSKGWIVAKEYIGRVIDK